MIVQLHQLIVCSTSNNCAQLLVVLLQTWSLVALIYNNWIFYIPTADEIEAGFEMEPAMCTTTRNIGGWIALADLIRQKIINIGSIAIGSIGFLDPIGSLVSTLLVVGWLLVTLFKKNFIFSVVVL